MEEATAYPGNTINRRKNDANNSRDPIGTSISVA